MYKTKNKKDISAQSCSFYKNLKIDDKYSDPLVLLDETRRAVVVNQKNDVI